MRSILLLCFALIAFPAAAADMLARQGGDSVRLTQEPCPVSVLKVIPEGSRGHFRKALATLGGLEYLACHAARNDGMVFLIYADGDAGLIPVGMFKIVPDT